jgi:hypothetical protein
LQEPAGRRRDSHVESRHRNRTKDEFPANAGEQIQNRSTIFLNAS